MLEKIQEHEDINLNVAFVQNMAWRWRRDQAVAMPSPTGAKRFLATFVSHGRWMAECPAGCGDAVVVSRDVLAYICTVCGNRDNDGAWYKLQFPPDRVAIERLLVKRVEPNRKANEQRQRNWALDQTVQDLDDENFDHGLGRDPAIPSRVS